MDIPLLPPVFAGYLPTVDLDAPVAALAPRLMAYATGATGCRTGALLDYLCKTAGCTWEYDDGSRQLRVRFQAP
jgi:hypothetical protein